MEQVRMLIQEEGREARNLLTFNISAVDDSFATNSKLYYFLLFSPCIFFLCLMLFIFGLCFTGKVMRKPPCSPRISEPRRPVKSNSRNILVRSGARVRSASTGRDKKSELRARYWALLFGNLQRSVSSLFGYNDDNILIKIKHFKIAEIYNTVETHESLTECQEVTLVLENYLRDFNGLAEWFRLKWEYENTPAPQRPTSLAWDICKTNLTKTSRSGKSTPIGSGRASPNVPGKTSPKPHVSRVKSPNTLAVPLNEETNVTQEVVKEVPADEVTEVSEPSTKTSLDTQTSIMSTSAEGELTSTSEIDIIYVKEMENGKTCVDTEVESLDSQDYNSLDSAQQLNKEGKSVNFEMLIEVFIFLFHLFLDKVAEDKEVLEFIKKQQKTKMIDSPSEDQRTYDIFRKVGVQSSEKSTSTDDDFPKLVRKSTAVKVSQECQTDDVVEKKVSPIKIRSSDVKPSKSIPIGRAAYSTALTRSASVRLVPTAKTKEVTKPQLSTKSKPLKSTQASVKSLPQTTPKICLARSKTVGDIKSTPAKSTNRPMFRLSTRPEPQKSTGKLIESKRSKPALSAKVKPENAAIAKLPKTNSINEFGSSAETLVNQTSTDNINATQSSNSMTSSVETLSNEKMAADGWFTVRCRSRFRNGNGKGRKSDTVLSWATRFHQISATASLPALALLPEANDQKLLAKSIDKNAKDNLNTLKSLKDKELTSLVNKPQRKPANMLMRRSHTTLSKITLPKSDSLKKLSSSKTNSSITYKKVEREKYEHKRKNIMDMDSETDDETKLKDAQEDLVTEEEHRQLNEEEERLNKEIEKLQGLEIEVDTETDGTETDCELQGDGDGETSEAALNQEEDEISLEARYEPMLAGKFNNFNQYSICSNNRLMTPNILARHVKKHVTFGKYRLLWLPFKIIKP